MRCPNCNITNHEPAAKFCHVCGVELIEDAQSYHKGESRLFLKISDNLYGYVDQYGVVVVEPCFSEARDFSEGLAAVKVGKTWGYIDRRGDMIIRPQYNRVGDFHESMAAVFDGHFWGFINMEGALVVPCQYHDVDVFSEKRAAVCKNYKWGYINPDGQRVIDLQFKEAHPFKDGLARIGEGSPKEYGFINRNGRVVISPSYERARDFSEGRAFVQCDEDQDSYYCYIDKKGNQCVICKWDFADDFHNELACVGVSGEFGFINKEGVMVIRPQFDDAASFSEGIAAIKVGDLWGYIDKTGKTIIAPQFIEAGIFQDGIAIVKDENGYAAINKRGIKLSDHLSTSQQASDRKALNRKYVVYGIHLEEEHRVEHIKHIHHLLLIIFAVLASLVEFCTFKYFHGWGWAFVPLVVNAVFTAYRIIVINETYKDDFNMYEFALTFVPIILINIAAFRWSNGWSLAILIPSLLLSIGVSELVHDNL